MRFGIMGGIIVVLSIWLATSERANAGHLGNNRDPGSGGCGQLVTLKHPELKGPARRTEISKCSANADAYSKQSGF
jgi:hypothetical protein